MTVLRSALFNAAFFGFTALAGLACLPLLPVLDRGGVLHMVSWWAGRVLALLRLLAGIRVRVLGEELPAARGSGNHRGQASIRLRYHRLARRAPAGRRLCAEA
ncbi:MAG: hypothetical protein RML45_00355 [Acetobacteraceae bacterium]|nr:hypothetical protein [Acetobacteraceae bacterium]